jgi:bifunctional non-homologous end joining protein LigD
MTYYAFDLLYVDGYDLRGSPLLARKDALQRIVDGAGGRFLYSQHLTDDGPTVHARACAMGIEGVVSKLAASPYRSGRTASWIKATCRKRETLVVVGFVPAPGGSLKAIYLGRRDGKALVYGGKAGTGFSGDTARALREKLDQITVRKSPLTVDVKKPKATWVKPQVVVDVEYRAVTADGRMRHGSFKAVREDLMS